MARQSLFFHLMKINAMKQNQCYVAVNSNQTKNIYISICLTTTYSYDKPNYISQHIYHIFSTTTICFYLFFVFRSFLFSPYSYTIPM